MKLEVEIDDNICALFKRIYGEETDLSKFITDYLQMQFIMIATHPEDLNIAFNAEVIGNYPESVKNSIIKFAEKYHVKSKEES